eukprot:CAMPEP_0178413228 /NCGR_PEP_ID=MMETSP0689_2-20121128/22421_1 /TAXON_ID=160604 /ORGANISM="Amphidinium massartii, Strain CS-259" /LENGTH=387 /DNA_ID=CAMNT_0020034497 /DNA_START=113 /DNA_END=1274 /DNA_ORIENTATION=+
MRARATTGCLCSALHQVPGGEQGRRSFSGFPLQEDFGGTAETLCQNMEFGVADTAGNATSSQQGGRSESEANHIYIGNNPISNPDWGKEWDLCPNRIAKRFAHSQRAAAQIHPDVRSSAGATGKVCLPSSRVSGEPCRKYFAVVECVLKAEPVEYIKEFIEHHLAVGFSHVFIWLDEAEDAVKQYKEALKWHEDNDVLTLWSASFGELQEERYVPQGIGHKLTARRCASSACAFWMARLDIDEFIVPLPPATSVVPMLLDLTGHIGGEVPLQLHMQRTNFGGGGWKDRPPAGIPIVEAYQRSDIGRQNIKSIFQLDTLLLPENSTGFGGNPHFIFANKATVPSCEVSWWDAERHTFTCYPDVMKTYHLTPLPADTVPDRIPRAQVVW